VFERVGGRLDVSWRTADGGFFLVVTLPVPAGEDLLQRSARDYGVLWTPMAPFYECGGGERQLRLSVSHVHDDAIDEGLDRFARLLTDICAPTRND
jgi:(S)-3,5-dihydroxyphenylglycine transaminase